MSIRPDLFAVFLSLLLVGCGAQPVQTLSPPQQRELEELNQHFAYHSQPVNPRALDELACWISDRYSGPVAIDMAGTLDSNRYYGSVEKSGGRFGFKRAGDDNGSFFYQHIGRLNNGLHVLHTINNTGGSGEFHSLMLIRFKAQVAFMDDGKKIWRIVMEQVGELPLGDRTDAELSVSGNSVVVKDRGKLIKTIRCE